MQLEDSIHIDGAPEVVWRVTAAIERWPEWTPTVTAVRRLDDGPLAVGSRAMLSQPGLPDATWEVTVFEPGKRFIWGATVRGMQMVATHELTPDGDGTRNLLRIEAEGLTARMLWPLIRSSLGRALAQENAGLKRRCEDEA